MVRLADSGLLVIIINLYQIKLFIALSVLHVICPPHRYVYDALHSLEEGVLLDIVKGY